MRKFGLVVLLLMATFGLSASPNTAAAAAPAPLVSDVSTCPAVKLTAPADGAVLDRDYKVRFTWSGEPKGTKTRDWVSIKLDVKKGAKFSVSGGTHAAADRGAYRTFGRGQAGVYTWFVLFKNAKGHVICMSPTRTYVVVEAASTAMSFFTSGGAPTVTVTISKGRYVVHLMGFSAGRSPTDNTTGYAGGVANWEKPGNTYIDAIDATGVHDWQAQGYEGLDVWGNGDPNTIVGSDKGDNIYGLAGNDVIAGGKGDDYIEGGNESCNASGFLATCHAGDAIGGGDGNDTIKGGDESCTHSGFLSSCSAGDGISGGGGNDTINGGKGNDIITGDGGADVVHGDDGDDAVTGNYPLNIGDGANDTVTGDAGNDIAVGTGGDTVTP